MIRYINNSAIHGEVWRATNPPINRWGRVLNHHWAAYDRDGRRIATGKTTPGYTSCEPTAEELEIWDAEAVRVAANAQAWPVDPTDSTLYIRFGRIPQNGKSRNHATGKYEAGVSVYRTAYDTEFDSLFTRDALPDALIEAIVDGRPAYLVTGDECGIGSDGEPVLTGTRIVATLIGSAEGFRIA